MVGNGGVNLFVRHLWELTKENPQQFQGTSITGMFKSCSNLTALDLSSFDLCNCTGVGEVFNAASDLDEIVVPINMQSNVSIELPGLFTDAAGTEYTELPTQLTESITITRR